MLLLFSDEKLLGFSRVISVSKTDSDGDQPDYSSSSDSRSYRGESPYWLDIFWLNKNTLSLKYINDKLLKDYPDYLIKKSDADKIDWFIARRICDALEPDMNLDLTEIAVVLDLDKLEDSLDSGKRDRRNSSRYHDSWNYNKFDYNIFLDADYQEYVEYVNNLRIHQANGSLPSNFTVSVAAKVSESTIKMYVEDLCHRIKNYR